jgi:hypothetical protein
MIKLEGKLKNKKRKDMKKFIQPIIIGVIAGTLPYFIGYDITMWMWWILMPTFSLIIWLLIIACKFINIFDQPLRKFK